MTESEIFFTKHFVQLRIEISTKFAIVHPIILIAYLLNGTSDSLCNISVIILFYFAVISRKQCDKAGFLFQFVVLFFISCKHSADQHL